MERTTLTSASGTAAWGGLVIGYNPRFLASVAAEVLHDDYD